MADWYGNARSSYFRVVYKDKFVQWSKSFGDNLKVVKDNEGRVALLSHAEKGNWPLTRYDPKTDEEEEEDIDLIGEVAAHLQEGSVAVFTEIGAESLRYLTGWAVAINSKGEKVEVKLNDIYERARCLGHEITGAEY